MKDAHDDKTINEQRERKVVVVEGYVVRTGVWKKKVQLPATIPALDTTFYEQVSGTAE